MQPEKFYHIYNHANGWDNLFEGPEFYEIFLKKALKFFYPVASIHAFCLMPNHFHLLIKIHDEATMQNRLFQQKQIVKLLKMSNKDKGIFKLKVIDPYFNISNQISRLFNSYAQIFNLKTGRKGNLFQRNFKSAEIDNEEYLKNVVRYIHLNPVHHNFTSRAKDWPWSSYNEYLFDKPGIVIQDEILSIFGGRETLLDFHMRHSEIEDWDY